MEVLKNSFDYFIENIIDISMIFIQFFLLAISLFIVCASIYAIIYQNIFKIGIVLPCITIVTFSFFAFVLTMIAIDDILKLIKNIKEKNKKM